jgi:hypothetical protein
MGNITKTEAQQLTGPVTSRRCGRCRGAGFGPWHPQQGVCYACGGTGSRQVLTPRQKLELQALRLKGHMAELEDTGRRLGIALDRAAGVGTRGLQRDLETARTTWRKLNNELKLVVQQLHNMDNQTKGAN